MKLKRLIIVALKSITKNRMRSALTMLGIIIGVGAVIALISVGKGTQAKIENEIGKMGTNLISVRPGADRRGGVSRGAGSMQTLTLKDIDKLGQADLIADVSAVVGSQAQVVAGNNNWQTSIQGVDTSYLRIRDWELSAGRFFDEQDNRIRAKVAVLGKTVATELFGESDPIGSRIRVGNVPFVVVGVLEEKGEGPPGNDRDDILLAPYTTVLYRMGDGTTIHSIVMSGAAEELMTQAQEEATQILRQSHGLRADEEDDFRVRSQTDILETASNVTGMLILLLGVVAGVSLLVGGIGIMNIMLVSVTERTREIGIRLAVGAREADVLMQFLIEAVVLCLIGGLAGIGFGLGIGYVLGRLIDTSIVVDPIIIATAFLFSGGVGVFFGFYPARKASKLNPIDALRHE